MTDDYDLVEFVVSSVLLRMVNVHCFCYVCQAVNYVVL